VGVRERRRTMIRRERSGASRKNITAAHGVSLSVCSVFSSVCKSDKRAAVEFQPGCQLQKGTTGGTQNSREESPTHRTKD